MTAFVSPLVATLRRVRTRYESWRFRLLQGDRETPAARARRTRVDHEGLSGFRERWWLTTRFEPAATVWRYLRLLEGTPDPDAASGPVPDRARCAIYSPGHIGDILQAAPMLRALRLERPAWQLLWLVGPWSEGLARALDVAQEVLPYAPAWSQYHRGRPQGGRGWRAEESWLQGLAGRRADVFVSTAGSDLATFAVGRALRPRVWCGVEPDWPLYPVAPRQHLLPYRRDQPEAEYLLDLVRPLGIRSTDATLRMRWSPADDAAADEALRPLAGRTIVALAPGGGWAGKLWPAESYGALGRRLIDAGTALVFVGSADERTLVEQACRGVDKGHVLDLAGKTSIAVLAAVLSRCALLVCNDSGPLHLAAAAGVPTVSLFGPTRPQKWAPRGDRHVALRAVEHCPDCLPWHPRARCAHNRACMRAISVDRVHDAAMRLLRPPAALPA